MTMAMENYIIKGIEEIIRDNKSVEKVWDLVEDKFGDAGVEYLEDMNYPYPEEGMIVE